MKRTTFNIKYDSMEFLTAEEVGIALRSCFPHVKFEVDYAASRESRVLSDMPSDLPMRLHEIKDYPEQCVRAMRVHGGWIYTFWDVQKHYDGRCIFVPERGI